MTSSSLGTPSTPPANARVLLDPAKLDPTGHTSIDWYTPSLDGSLVAVGIAVGGSERSALTVFDTTTGKQVGDPFVSMGFHGKRRSVAWLPGNKGFIYAGYTPAVATAGQATLLKNQKVFEHVLGTPETEDRVVLDKGLTPLAQIALDSDPSGKWIVASAEDGDGGTYANFVREPGGSWEQISTYSDEIVTVTPGIAVEDMLYLTSLKDAPRGKILESQRRPRYFARQKPSSLKEEPAYTRRTRGRFPPGAGDDGPYLCNHHRRGTEPCPGVRPQRKAAPGSAAAARSQELQK